MAINNNNNKNNNTGSCNRKIRLALCLQFYQNVENISDLKKGH